MEVKNISNIPLVSVIIPAYNHENYIGDTIQSIIDQTYDNIELIIIDDGSTDSTYTVIQNMLSKCKKRFTRILAKSQTNIGCSETVNNLLKQTSGEFIYIIASDDIAKPQAIEKLVTFLTTHNDYLLAVGDNEFIDEQGKRCYWGKKREIIYNELKSTYKTFADYLQRQYKFKFCTEKFGSYPMLYIGNHIPNGYLIRRSILDKIPHLSKEAPLEDWFLMLQLAKYGKMKFLDEVLFSYRWHNMNTVCNSEYMDHITRTTRVCENQLLENLDFLLLFPCVQDVFKNGVIARHHGIPHILEIMIHFSTKEKSTIIKLFDIEITRFVNLW